jgi:hypothetical protein
MSEAKRQFRISATPRERRIWVVILSLPIAGIAVVLTLAFFNVIAWSIALAAIGLCVAALVIWGRDAGRSAQGVAEFTEDYLMIRWPSGTMRYLWSHILDVQLTDKDQALPSPAMGTVRLRLSRSLHRGAWGGPYGTDVGGLPIFFTRQPQLYVEDPHSFAEVAIASILAHRAAQRSSQIA